MGDSRRSMIAEGWRNDEMRALYKSSLVYLENVQRKDGEMKKVASGEFEANGLKIHPVLVCFYLMNRYW